MIIDAHIHLYPPHAYEKVEGWAQERDESYWLSCVAPEAGPKLQGWASLDQLRNDMQAAKVDKVVIQSWYWENHHTCLETQQWHLDWLGQMPKSILAFAPFNAKGEQAALDLLEAGLQAGLAGVGELNPPAQGYGYDNPWLDQAIALATRYSRPVNFHVTEPGGRHYPGKIDTPFSDLLALAQRHPEATFIFSHLGGLLPLHALNKATRQALRNVYFDTAAVPLLYDKTVYRMICDVIGPDRILFGTDYPLRTFPRRQESPDFTKHLQSLRNASLSKAELEAILGGNAAKLLQL